MMKKILIVFSTCMLTGLSLGAIGYIIEARVDPFIGGVIMGIVAMLTIFLINRKG